MRYVEVASVVSLLMVMVATTAAAIVSVDHVANTGGAPVAVGDTFSVDVIASWDGSPSLIGLFTSTYWDPSQIQLLGATNAPTQIFAGPNGSLGRFSNPFQQPGDLPGTLRTVQYGAFPSQTPTPGPSVLITRITFAVLAVGDGVAEISAFIAQGDIIFGSDNSAMPPSGYMLGSASVAIVPEPGTGLLVGLGIAILSQRRRRTSSHVLE